MAAPCGGVLEARGLSVDFPGGVRAVRGVDLSLRRGEILGVVGESGSGKTALARALAGLHGPGAALGGRLALDGATLPLDGRGPAWAAVRGRRIGMVFQEAMAILNPVRRVGATLDATLALDGLARAARRERALALLAGLGFAAPERVARSFPHELSGGMRQRVGLALALARDPDILIADEPTTALDVLVQAEIAALLRAEARRRGLAVLFVSHDLGLVAALCDRVAVMYAGRVVEVGPAGAVFARPAHRYTAALLAAMPEPDGPARLGRGIPGEPMAATAPDAGCAFAPRCAAVREACRGATPAQTRAGDPQHRAACLAPAAAAERAAAAPPPLRGPEPGAPLFRLEGVGHVFRGARPAPWRPRPVFRVLDGIALTLSRGECLALVGRSGSGKSTLARILTGALRPTEGSARFDGAPIPAWGSAAHRAFARRVQIVLQSPLEAFDPRLPVGRQIIEPLVIHGVGDAARRRDRLDRLAAQVALAPELLARSPAALSGGQLQRAAIARALALGPEALVCDEPVSALDLSVQGQIVSLLADLQREGGLTMLFVTHDLGLARQIAHRIAVLDAGRLVEIIDPATPFGAARHPATRALGAAIPRPAAMAARETAS